jgi:hypothetical protein
MTQSPYKRLVTEAQLDAKVAAGLVGPVGPAGPTASLSIGSISKLAPGSTPTVQITGVAPNQLLNMGIVTGDTGAKGDPGDNAPATASSIGATLSILGAAGTHRLTLTGAITATLPASPASTVSFTRTFVFVQDVTGSRTVAWPTGIKWTYGIKPTLSTAPGAIDVVHLFWTGTEWLGFTGGQAFA